MLFVYNVLFLIILKHRNIDFFIKKIIERNQFLTHSPDSYRDELSKSETPFLKSKKPCLYVLKI